MKGFRIQGWPLAGLCLLTSTCVAGIGFATLAPGFNWAVVLACTAGLAITMYLWLRHPFRSRILVAVRITGCISAYLAGMFAGLYVREALVHATVGLPQALRFVLCTGAWVLTGMTISLLVLGLSKAFTLGGASGVRGSRDDAWPHRWLADEHRINPATGLPMTSMAHDVGGNTYGCNDSPNRPNDGQ